MVIYSIRSLYTLKVTIINYYIDFMKKTIISALSLGIIFSVSSVFAGNDEDVRLPASPEINSVSIVSEPLEKSSTSSSLTRIKSRGAQLIRERINSLESNKKVIDASKTLTIDQKTSLSTIITTNISGLSALNISIASSTDATSTKAFVSSIFTNFRIYGIVLPKIRLERRIFDLQNHSVKLSEAFVKVQTKIDEQKVKGKDVAEWQKLLDDSKVTVALDMNILNLAFTRVNALTAADYGTTSAMIIATTNTELKKVSKDFNGIMRTLHKPAHLKKAYKQMESSTSTKIRKDTETR